eukprot:390186-Pyramimonas_sp.AAC.1
MCIRDRPLGSSTEGSVGSVRMRPRHPVRHTLHAVRGFCGAPPNAPVAAFARARGTQVGTPFRLI